MLQGIRINVFSDLKCKPRFYSFAVFNLCSNMNQDFSSFHILVNYSCDCVALFLAAVHFVPVVTFICPHL